MTRIYDKIYHKLRPNRWLIMLFLWCAVRQFSSVFVLYAEHIQSSSKTLTTNVMSASVEEASRLPGHMTSRAMQVDSQHLFVYNRRKIRTVSLQTWHPSTLMRIALQLTWTQDPLDGAGRSQPQGHWGGVQLPLAWCRAGLLQVLLKRGEQWSRSWNPA